MRGIVLAAADGNPKIQLLDLGTGGVMPVPSPIDGRGAFDSGLLRDGWVAVKVGYKLAAFRDGSLSSPTLLPRAWQIGPAVEPELMLLTRYEGRSLNPDEGIELTVVGADGTVRRSSILPQLQGLVGEIEAGVVGGGGLWSWTGERLAVPGAGTPIGVLGGSAIVLAREGEIEVVDVRGRGFGTCPVPPDARFGLDVRYDALATRLAATAWNTPGVLVADLDSGPQWIPLDLVPRGPVWLGEDRLLLFDPFSGTDGIVLDVAAGSATAMSLPPRGPTPQLEVTERFDMSEAGRVHRPARWSPPTPAQRDAALARARQALEAAATPSTVAQLRHAAPAVLLRACVPDRRLPVGGSRLGGQPDLPAGLPWPTHDGEPMAFLAQVRLDEVASSAPNGALPAEGLLIVFVALEADGCYPADEHAVHAEIVPVEELQRGAWPAGLPEELRFNEAQLLPEPILTLPPTPPTLAEADETAWWNLLKSTSPGQPDHRLLGHPRSIQGNPPPTDDQGRPRSLLLQIDSDSISGFSFGDGGLLHLWVPAGALGVGSVASCIVEVDSG